MHEHPLSPASQWLLGVALVAGVFGVGFLVLLGIGSILERLDDRRIAKLRREHYARHFPHLLDDQDKKPGQQ